MAMVEAHRVVRRSSLTIVNSYVEMGIFCCFFERVEDDNHEPIRCGSVQRERQGKAMPAGFQLVTIASKLDGSGHGSSHCVGTRPGSVKHRGEVTRL